jgi:hypothetical protein
MNIIGISGRAESGKNTLAKIVQGMTYGYNKDTVMQMLSQSTKKQSLDIEYCDWEVVGFANKLKQVASILTGIPQALFEDQDFKKRKLGNEWEMTYGLIGCIAVPIQEHSKNDKENKIFNTPMDVRTFLQKLGTEAIRNNLHGDAWVNALWADYKPDEQCYTGGASEESWNKIKPKWLITDVRFPNEYQSVKDRGGVMVRLKRNSDVVATHESETSLDNYDFDYTIDNRDLSLEELYEEVEKMLVHFEIIN